MGAIASLLFKQPSQVGFSSHCGFQFLDKIRVILGQYTYLQVKFDQRCSYLRSASKMLTGKPTGNRSLGRPKRRWEDSIRMDREEMRVIGLIRLRIGIIGEPL